MRRHENFSLMSNPLDSDSAKFTTNLLNQWNFRRKLDRASKTRTFQIFMKSLQKLSKMVSTLYFPRFIKQFYGLRNKDETSKSCFDQWGEKFQSQSKSLMSFAMEIILHLMEKMILIKYSLTSKKALIWKSLLKECISDLVIKFSWWQIHLIEFNAIQKNNFLIIFDLRLKMRNFKSLKIESNNIFNWWTGSHHQVQSFKMTFGQL